MGAVSFDYLAIQDITNDKWHAVQMSQQKTWDPGSDNIVFEQKNGRFSQFWYTQTTTSEATRKQARLDVIPTQCSQKKGECCAGADTVVYGTEDAGNWTQNYGLTWGSQTHYDATWELYFR